jgi:hypothetical protein
MGAGAGLGVLETNMALMVLPRFEPKIFLFSVLTLQVPRSEPGVTANILFSVLTAAPY